MIFEIFMYYLAIGMIYGVYEVVMFYRQHRRTGTTHAWYPSTFSYIFNEYFMRGLVKGIAWPWFVFMRVGMWCLSKTWGG